MKPDLFVDAGGWVALSHASDNHHAAAVKAYPLFLREFRELVTTTLVVAEAYTILRMKTRSFDALRFLEVLATSTRVVRAPVNARDEGKAEEILRQYADQRFSYADAVSFAVMRRRGISEAFAFDKHFAIAGFTCVPAV